MGTMVKGYFRYIVFLLATAAMVLCGRCALAQAAVSDSTGFPPLDQWKAAILEGDAAGLKAFYSTDPEAEVQANGVTAGADADVNFWLGLKARSIKVEIVRLKEHPDAEGIIFKAEVQTGLPNGQVMSVTDA
jgi:hypothetical protein